MDIYVHSPIRLHDVVLNQLSIGTTLPLQGQPIIFFFLLFLVG
jgi:hypothetical protein